jgi:hypothetical protein
MKSMRYFVAILANVERSVVQGLGNALLTVQDEGRYSLAFPRATNGRSGSTSDEWNRDSGRMKQGFNKAAGILDAKAAAWRSGEPTTDTSWREDATRTPRVLQVIVAALTAGTLFFLVIALTIGPFRTWLPGPQPWRPLTLFAIVLTAVALVVRPLVVWAIVGKTRREIVTGTHRPIMPQRTGDESDKLIDDGQCLLGVFATKTIIGAAVFEGVAFLATLAYLFEGEPMTVGLALSLILGVASHFPTQSRTIDWVERQLETVQQEKMMR